MFFFASELLFFFFFLRNSELLIIKKEKEKVKPNWEPWFVETDSSRFDYKSSDLGQGLAGSDMGLDGPDP